MSVSRIIIFAKAPVAGQAKTRLVPALGEDGAAELARDMLRATVNEALAANLGTPELCVTPGPEDRAWVGLLPALQLHITDQGSGDLGERLGRAATRALALGQPVILIGADCPALARGHLRAAAAALEDHDAVIFPAIDGGYVLLGLRRFHPSLFRDMPWSTSAVARETLDRIAALGWTVHVGESLHDIDRPEDLCHIASPDQIPSR